MSNEWTLCEDLNRSKTYNLVMSSAARQLIDSFEALPEQEKYEVLSQLLRRLMDTPYASPTEDELTRAADLIFQEYDRLEAQG